MNVAAPAAPDSDIAPESAPAPTASMAPDPQLAYQRARTAFIAMSEELLAAALDIMPDTIPPAKHERYVLARRGLTSALSLLMDTQYTRLSMVVINDQRSFGQQIDSLAALIRDLQSEGRSREHKIDRLLAAIDPLAATEYPKGT